MVLPDSLESSDAFDTSDCVTVYPSVGYRLKAGSVDPTADADGGEAVENPEATGADAPEAGETEKQVESEETVFDRPSLCGMKLRLCLFIWSGFIASFALLHLIGAFFYPGTGSKVTTAIFGLIIGGFAGALIFIAYKKKDGPFKIVIYANWAMMGIIVVCAIVLLITVWTASVASVDEGVAKAAMKNKPEGVSEDNYVKVKKYEDPDVMAYFNLDEELTGKKKTATGYLIVVCLLNIGAHVPIWILIRRAINN